MDTHTLPNRYWQLMSLWIRQRKINFTPRKLTFSYEFLFHEKRGVHLFDQSQWSSSYNDLLDTTINSIIKNPSCLSLWKRDEYEMNQISPWIFLVLTVTLKWLISWHHTSWTLISDYMKENGVLYNKLSILKPLRKLKMVNLQVFR